MKQIRILLLKPLIYLSICLFFVVGCSGSIEDLTNIDSSGEVIVCFGGKVTKGFGAPRGQDYPSLISMETDIPVINIGRDNASSARAMDDIDEALEGFDPLIVIVELGSSDMVDTLSLAETEANISAVVKKLQEEWNAIVILVSPEGAGPLKDYAKIFKRVAKKKKAALVPGGMKGIMIEPMVEGTSWEIDSSGYGMLAEKIIEVLMPVLEKNQEIQQMYEDI